MYALQTLQFIFYVVAVHVGYRNCPSNGVMLEARDQEQAIEVSFYQPHENCTWIIESPDGGMLYLTKSP